jgi:hypothetical protein
VSDAAAQRRARQTVINLGLSLLATLGLVLAIVLMVPRDDSSKIPRIDYAAVAANAADSSKFRIVAPKLPAEWWSNKAQWSANPADTVPAFTAGFVGPDNEYIGMIQGFNANPTWLALKLQGTELTGAKDSSWEGHWDIYTAKVKNDPAKDWDYVRVLKLGENDYVILYGNAAMEDFDFIASSIELKKAQY